MAATLAPDNELVYFSFPIEKAEDTEAVNPVDGTPDLEIWGKATDGTVDRDLQIVDPQWSAAALRSWLETGGNVRFAHDARRPVGKGKQVEITPDGHYVKSLIADPLAKHYIRNGILTAYSVGISHPDIRYGSHPQLDPEGKAVNGIITGRKDGLSEVAELSIVDRPSNYGTKFQLVRKGADGIAEFTGKVIGADDMVTKTAAGTVNVDVPKSASITFSPGDLAKLLEHRKVAEARETAVLKAMAAAEATVYKRDIDTATRRRLAGEGRALPDLSYPIETHEDADNAVTLALSGHGNVGAAKKLIRRIASKEGWQDILNRLDGKKPKKAKKEKSVDEPQAAAVAGPDEAKAAPVEAPGTDVVKDGDGDGKAPVMHHDDGQDDDTDSDADAMDKTAEPDAGKDAVVLPRAAKPACAGCGKKMKRNAPFCHNCGKPSKGATKAIKPTPGDGVTGEHTEPAPEHREPDGPAIEALEHDAHLPTVPDSSVKSDDLEMRVAAHHKALGVDRDMGVLHDLTCPAYAPADVAKAHPGADFSLISIESWLDKTLTIATGAPLDEARKMAQIVDAIVALKAVAPDLAADIRDEAHKAFRDANPGPGKAPTPGEISAQRYNRPYITEGHAAPSPGHDAPHTAPIHPGHIAASDFHRDFISPGHAADSPSNDTPRAEPVPAPEVPGVPSRVFYTRVQRQNAQQAMQAMHDHIAQTFPDLCPMHGPGHMGTPPSHAQPVPAGAGGPTPHGAGKAAGKPDEYDEAEALARAARKAAKLEKKLRKVRAGIRTEAAAPATKAADGAEGALTADLAATYVAHNIMSVDEARVRLGLSPKGDGGAVKAAISGSPAPIAPVVAKTIDPDLIKSAIAEAQAPLMERLDAQQKLLDAMADQPDPNVTAYRGVALTKSSAAPAGPLSLSERAVRAQDNYVRDLFTQARDSSDPGQRLVAWESLMKLHGITE